MSTNESPATFVATGSLLPPFPADVCCATCEHWTGLAVVEPWETFGGQLTEPFQMYGYRADDRDPEPDEVPLWGACHRESAADTPMFTYDASDYVSGLRTKPDFACRAFTPRMAP